MNVSTTNDTALQHRLPVYVEIFSMVFFGGNLLFCLPVHYYVIWVMIRRQQKMASEFILLNQIFVEVLFSLAGMSYFISIYLFMFFNMKPFQFFSTLFLIMRPMLQSYVCIEQHLAAVHPVIFFRYKAMWYKVAICCACWLTSIAMSLVGISVNLNVKFFYMVAALYVLFLLLMTYCCVSVLRVLRRRAPGEGQREQHGMKKKAFNIILINLVLTCMGQLPMVIILSLLARIPFTIFITVYTVIINAFVVTGLVPSLRFLRRAGKLSSICKCL